MTTRKYTLTCRNHGQEVHEVTWNGNQWYWCPGPRGWEGAGMIDASHMARVSEWPAWIIYPRRPFLRAYNTVRYPLVYAWQLWGVTALLVTFTIAAFGWAAFAASTLGHATHVYNGVNIGVSMDLPGGSCVGGEYWKDSGITYAYRLDPADCK